ncbi:phage portal protein [Actinopolyspora xinjiangensis]|nr:phage portal protein [Actinopolyspora xinjiangensis]
MTGDQVEQPGHDIMAFSRRMYANNGIVYACMSMRAHVFSAIRFAFQRFEQTRPSGMFGTRALRVFERPWPGGSTQDLLSLIIQDLDLAGNSYWVRRGDELVQLPADQVDIVLRIREDGLGYETAGYMHWPNGRGSGRRGIPLRVGEVAHVTPPTRDPFAPYKGMSWMRTVFSEIGADNLMERHKSKLFENGATPNMVVKMSNEVDDDSFEEYVAKFRRAHDGAENAGKTLFLAPGLDMEVVGKDLQQLDFSSIQGHAETRIAAAAGVPPQIIPLSEGMQGSSLNANVYSSARRRFADATMHPLWQTTASSLAVLAEDLGGSARLWYDTRDVPFIREDEADVSAIQQNRAQTIRTLVDSGYTAESVVEAVNSDDIGLLQHSGLFSVQLHPPGDTQSVTDPDAGSSEGGSS